MIFKRECNLTAIKYTFRISLSHFAKLVITPSNYAHLIAFDLHFIAPTTKNWKIDLMMDRTPNYCYYLGFFGSKLDEILFGLEIKFFEKSHVCTYGESPLQKRLRNRHKRKKNSSFFSVNINRSKKCNFLYKIIFFF